MPKIVRIAVTPRERRSLQSRYKVEGHPRIKERLQMLLLSDTGKSQTEVADIVGRTIWTVSDVLRAFKKKGLDGLAPKPQSGNHRKLSQKQRKKVRQLLQKSPQSLGYPSSFWTVHWVRTLVKDRFAILYAKSDSYQALLYEANFSFHRPGKIYRQQDPTTVRKWLSSTKKN